MIYAGETVKTKTRIFYAKRRFRWSFAAKRYTRNRNDKFPCLVCDSHSNGETTGYLTFDRSYVPYAVDGIFSSRFSSRSCKSDSTVKSMSQFPASSSNRPGAKWPRAVGAQSTMPNDSCRSPVEDPTEVCTLSSVLTGSSYQSFLDIVSPGGILDWTFRVTRTTLSRWGVVRAPSNARNDRRRSLFEPIKRRLLTTNISDTDNINDGVMQMLHVYV